jgi:hypothetical protein
MNTYYLRTINYPQLLDFGVALGVLQATYDEHDEDGEPVGEPTISATDCGYLDYIGVIERPTGDADMDDLPVMAPITNPDGVPYLHANLITPHDIRALAEASDDPEIQAALSDIAAWFIVDEEGNAVAPANPHRVFG